MSRDNACYTLNLTEEEFHELRHILRACDYFHQIGVMYNHVLHLDRLFEEAERDANDYCIMRAREVVSQYYTVARQLKTDNPHFQIKLAIEERVLKNSRALDFLSQNIPEGSVEWYIIPEIQASRFNEELQDPEVFRPSYDSLKSKYISWILNKEEDSKVRGFFAE